MERRVYWSSDQESHVWHLYWDCPELKNVSQKQGGSTEAAINRGKTHVCPICRARYDKEFPVPYTPPPKESPAPQPKPEPVQKPPAPKPAPAPAPQPAKPEKKKQPWGKMIASAVVAGLLVWLCLEVFYSDLIVRNHDIWYDRGFSAGYDEGYNDGLKDSRASTPTPTPRPTPRPVPTFVTFRVTASVDCIYNNSVGNEWSYYFEAGSEILPATITARAGDDIMLFAKITEDDSIPDVGTWQGTTTVKEEYLENGFHTTVEVYVTEGSGRYSGNEAKFEVTFNFEPQ